MIQLEERNVGSRLLQLEARIIEQCAECEAVSTSTALVQEWSANTGLHSDMAEAADHYRQRGEHPTVDRILALRHQFLQLSTAIWFGEPDRRIVIDYVQIVREIVACFHSSIEGQSHQPGDVEPTNELPPAYWLGDCKVQIGAEVMVLARSHAAVLEKLVEVGAADYPTLGRLTDYTSHDAAKILKRIKARPDLAPYIRLAGIKGRGYSTTIVKRLPSK
jgi:hypothetical protein